MFIAPDTPTAITFSNIGAAAMSLSWSIGNTTIINATTVSYRVTGTVPWTAVPVVPASATTTTVSSLLPGNSYDFTVTVQSFGSSAVSSVFNQTTCL